MSAAPYWTSEACSPRSEASEDSVLSYSDLSASDRGPAGRALAGLELAADEDAARARSSQTPNTQQRTTTLSHPLAQRAMSPAANSAQPSSAAPPPTPPHHPNAPLGPEPSLLSRPSGYSARPHITNQGRLRSRSINNSAQPPQLSSTSSSSNSSAQNGAGQGLADGYLAPTLVGSPDLAQRGADQQSPDRQSGSTSKHAPSITLSNYSPPWANGGSSKPCSNSSASRDGPYAAASNAAYHPQPRRGRSFTSLLVQPVTPGGVTPFENVAEEAEADYFNEKARAGSPSTSSAQSAPPSPEDLESGFHPRLESPAGSPTISQRSAYVNGDETAAGKRMVDFLPHIGALVVLFLGSFGLILALVATLPTFFIPHSFSQLPALVKNLMLYRASTFTAEVHLFAVLSALFVWKQAFSVPGSILTNAMFGALYGTAAGTMWACLWTAVGSTGAYGIARVLAPLVEYYFATPLAVTRRTLKLASPAELAQPGAEPVVPLSAGDMFSYLLLARFFPLLPYSVLNVISGVLQLPLVPFFVTLVLGSFPFNLVTVSVGSIVALAASDPSVPLGDKIWSVEMFQKLVLVTIASVAPLVFKRHIQKALGNPRLAQTVVSLPSRAVWGMSRVADAIVRQVGVLGGFGAAQDSAAPSGGYQPIPSPTANGHSSSPSSGSVSGRASHETSSSESGSSSTNRTWRHKFNPSWGGDGFRLIETLAGAGRSNEAGELLGRWEGEQPGGPR